MKILVYGESRHNKTILAAIKLAGHKAVPVPDVYALRNFSGEEGNFTALLRKGVELKTEYALLMEQPHSPPPPIGGGSPLELDFRSPPQDPLIPVVILLDYYNESPPAATIEALKGARELAAGRPVYFLSRVIHAGTPPMEVLYAQARARGVRFIRYDSVDILHNPQGGRFDVRANDGTVEYRIGEVILYADGASEVGERFAYAVDRLNLITNEQGYLREDRFYLPAVFTGRRGVFAVGREIAAQGLEEGLAAIFERIAGPEHAPERVRAQVNGNKCAFCFNCYRACPHDALHPDTEVRKMTVLEKACEGCGICMPVCPGNAITLGGWDGRTDGAANGETLILCCENSAEIALRELQPHADELGGGLDIRPVPCGGSVGAEALSDALLKYQRVMVATCKDGACRHFEGSGRARGRTARLLGMLESAGVDAIRMRFEQVSSTAPEALREAVIAFCGE